MVAHIHDHHSNVWLVVFIPAVLYYLFLYSSPVESNWGIFSGLELSQPVLTVAQKGFVQENNHVLFKQVEAIIHVNRALPVIADNSTSSTSSYSLYYPLESIIRVTDSIRYHFQSLLWRHDPDLGRGYLLISESLNSGRVWRWEVGGGPITIGRSLFLENSGCRSGLWENPCPTNHGSGGRSILNFLSSDDTPIKTRHDTMRQSQRLMGSSGIAIQPATGKDKSSLSGLLLVAELGERRIVRIEENGARTPIVLNIPSLCSKLNTVERLHAPSVLLTVTPTGHLLFTASCQDMRTTVAGVYKMPDISNIPSLPTHLSHGSHAWKSLADWLPDRSDILEQNIQLIFHGNLSFISGLAIDHDSKSMFVSGMIQSPYGGIQYIIYKVPLHESDEDIDDDDDDDEDDVESSPMESQNVQNRQCNYNSHNGDESDSLTGACGTVDDSEPKLKGLYEDEASLFFDMTDYFHSMDANESAMKGPAMTVDSLGNIYATYPGGFLILNKDGQLITTIPFEADMKDTIPTSIALSLNDGYLYISTETSLLRMKIKTKPFTFTLDSKRNKRNSM